MFARNGTLDGLKTCPSPWRLRSATGTPSTSVVTMGPEGFPKGVSTSWDRECPRAPIACSSPDPPMIPSIAPPFVPRPACLPGRTVYTKERARRNSRRALEKDAAATYSPAQLPVQYHRLWQA